MREPIKWTLLGDRGLNLIDTIPIVGRDFTGATFACQVRVAPDATGSPLISPTLTLTYGGTDTVANHVAAGRLTPAIYKYQNANTQVNYVASDSVPLSLIHINIDNSLMKEPTIPAASEEGDDLELAWDLLITPSGSVQDKWVYGPFIVRGTVTQP